jgi:hypothetical protein
VTIDARLTAGAYPAWRLIPLNRISNRGSLRPVSWFASWFEVRADFPSGSEVRYAGVYLYIHHGWYRTAVRWAGHARLS